MPWPKGKPRSEETKRKVSEANRGNIPWIKGIHHSEETKRKLSKVLRGRVPWNKGLTKEIDPIMKRLSEANKGQIPWVKGKHLSEEYKQKISEALKGKNSPNFGTHLSEETKRKLSLAHSGENHPFYGKHHSDESRRKMSLSRSGENNYMYGKTGEKAPRWLGGKSFEPYGVEFNDELKKQIRERDNYQCQLCGLYEEELLASLSVHHIDYNKENNDPQNLVSLCNFCHAKTNVNRDYWEAYFNEIGILIPAIT